MAGFIQDLKYGVRTLLKNPGFTAIAVVALALGIGANSAIFTVVNALLLRPLPYRQPDRLAVLWQSNASQGWEKVGVSGSNYMDWKEQSRLLQDICVFEPGSGTLTGQGEPEQIAGLRISSNFFQTLGVKPHLGRLFTEADEKQWMSVGVISYGAWQQRFGGDPTAIGRKMTVDGLSYTLIGVVEPNFWFPFAADAFVVWDQAALRRTHRLDHSLGAIGRLKPGVTLAQASSELNAIEKGINARFPDHEGWSVSTVPLKETVVEYIRPALLVLLGAVGFVLLIACTNVANLLLARGAARQKEIAIRASMGAGRLRIVRQMLTESVVLSLVGGGLGLLLASWGTQVLLTLLPDSVPIPGSSGQIKLAKIGIDGWVLMFTFGISILTGIIFGMVPAISCSKTSPVESLKEGGRSSRTGTARWRAALVISEVALALVLLAGATLMLRSMARLQTVDPGFRGGQLLTFEIELPTDTRYRSQKDQGIVFEKFLRSLRETPGLENAAVTRAVPFGPEQERTFFSIEGRPPLVKGEHLGAEFRPASVNYLTTMGIPLLRGRHLSDLDRAESQPVAIIDANLERKFFPDQDAIGHRIITRGKTFEIVGVAGQVKHSGLNKAAQPTIYVPFVQSPMPRMDFVIRSAGDPAALTRAAKAAIWRVDRDQPLYRVKTMQELMADSATAPRLTLFLLGSFAVLAVTLAALGIYGVMSYTVNQRRQELGIRIALGAATGQVMSMVVREAMLLAGAGVVIGLVASLAVTRYLSTLLYGISATDPLTLAAVAAALAVVALVASYIPARRATRVHPIQALRYE